MDRPVLLAVPVALLAAVVVALRGIVALETVRSLLDLQALALLSRGLWSFVAVTGFPAVGYAYAERTDGGPVARTLGVAGLAAFVGAVAGTLTLWFGAGAGGHGSMAVETASLGLFATLDAATFGLLTLGGYALSVGDRGG